MLILTSNRAMVSPEFSVVIPCRDDPLVWDAVHSVLSQGAVSLEVLVVDDGSQPPIAQASDRRVRVLRHSTPLGPAAARDTGIRNASGSFVAFCDSDDLYVEGRLDCARQLHQLAEVVVVGQGRVGDVRSVSFVPRKLDSVLDRTNPHLGATSIRREIAPMMNPVYLGAQDIEWWVKVIEQKPTFASTPEVLYLHRPSDRPRVLNSQSARLRFSYQLFDDHGDFFKRHRRAAAYRWYRIAQMERQAREVARARRALVKSLLAYPTLRALKCVPPLVRPRSGGRPS